MLLAVLTKLPSQQREITRFWGSRASLLSALNVLMICISLRSDAAGLAQARERFALLGRDVSQLSDDQLRNLVAELDRRFRDEELTSAAQAATIILDGVKANRWRILVGADAHKIDEMVRQWPERAYDIGFFDEFALAAGWTERLSLENPELRQPS